MTTPLKATVTERLATLEAKMDDIHGDLHDLSMSVADLAKSLAIVSLETARKPTWFVVSYITLITGLLFAVVGGIAATKF